MPVTSSKKKTTSQARTSGRGKVTGSAQRTYDAEAQALLSLRLIAAPNPQDDLSDAELAALCKDPRRSPELIQHLIEIVKGL